MRFLELELKPFGRFEHETIHFPCEIDSLGGFHMIIGPNEAGKSTTLAAFQRFLFGFPANDIYRFGRKNLWVGAKLQLASGEIFKIWRKNSQARSLFGEDQKLERPAGMVDRFLDPIDSKTFMKLFGLNQETLRAGGLNLVSGKGEFADILFGESLGDLQQFDKIRGSLKKEADELFKPDGRSGTPLNKIRTKVQDLDKKLKENITTTNAWRDLESGRDGVQDRLRQVENTLIELRSSLTRIKNRIASRQLVMQLRNLRAELEPLAGLPRVDEKIRLKLTEAVTRLSGLDGGVDAANQEIRKKSDELAHVMIQQAFLDHGEEISSLADMASAIEQQRSGLGQLAKEIDGQQLDLKNRAIELGIPFDKPDQAPQLDMAARRRIEIIGQNITDLQEQLKQAQLDQARLRREMNKLQNGVGTDVVGDMDSTQLNVVLQKLRKISEQESRLEGIQKNLKKFQSHLDSKLEDLPCWQGDAAAFSRLRLPVREAVEIAEKQLSEAESALKTDRHRLNQLRLEVEGEQQSITKQRKQLTLPSLEDLLLVRQDRDQAWAEIDARWRQAADQPVHEKSVQADTYVQLVKTADRMADQLRDHAELVTKMLRLEDLRSQEETANKRLKLSEAENATAWDRWNSLWSFLAEPPAEPAIMKPWLTIGSEYEQLNQEIQTAQSEIQEIQNAWPAYRDQLIGDPTHTLISSCRTTEAAITVLAEKRDWLNSQKKLESINQAQIHDKNLELQNNISEQDLLNKKIHEENKVWSEVLSEHRISAGITPELFSKFASELANWHKDLQKQAVQLKKLNDQSEQLQQFDRDVHRVANATGFRENSESTTATIKSMFKLKGEQQELVKTKNRLEAEMNKARIRIDELREKGREDQETIRLICESIEVTKAELAEERFQGIFERDALEIDLDRKCKLLEPLRGGIGLEDWITEVESETLEQADAARESCERDIKEAEQTRTKLLTDLGEWKSKLSIIENRVAEARSLDIRNDQRLLVETTNDQIRNYLKFSITNKILEEAAQDYRKRMGDNVLSTACHYFHILSLGSFGGIRPEATNGGNKLVAVRNMDDPDSDELELNALSEGTRDQLYLALKLAMIRNRLVERQRLGQAMLPVILDDILVQFDDERSAAAFRLLGELSEMTQVIFLTHHGHLERVARAAFGERSFGIHRLTGSQAARVQG